MLPVVTNGHCILVTLFGEENITGKGNFLLSYVAPSSYTVKVLGKVQLGIPHFILIVKA